MYLYVLMTRIYIFKSCLLFSRIFDKDKSGTLDKDELKTCLQSLGEQLTDEEVDELFNALDTDRNGRLSVMGKKDTIYVKSSLSVLFSMRNYSFVTVANYRFPIHLSW